MKKIQEIEKNILSACPYCGEEYMFNRVSEEKYYDENGKLAMMIAKYYCDGCRTSSTIIHDFEKEHSYED